jgi:hypothetical protein
VKRRHQVLGAAFAGAALLAIFGDRSPDTGVAEAVQRPPGARASSLAADGAARKGPNNAGNADGPRILALLPREALIGDSDEQFRQGDNPVFGRQDWTPPPPPPAPPAPAPPPAPPSAPPLPFTFIGKSVADGAWEVYLAHGDRTYVVRDKTVIDGTYRVDTIAPPVLTLTYLPLNQVQQLNIGVFD